LSLKHDGMACLEEVHETKTSIYLVMEPLQGCDLFQYVTKQRATSLTAVQMIMKNLLEVLYFLSSKNVMHRDIKPENLIFKEKLGDSIVGLKLVNFGLATSLTQSNQLFRRCGTPGYMAPEIINLPSGLNINYDSKCDVFSAGVILYILTTGKAPFSGQTFQEILDSNKASIIDFENSKLNRFPFVKDLLQRMLDKSPESRLSAGQCLKHEFFKATEQTNNFRENSELTAMLTKSIHELFIQQAKSMRSRQDIKSQRESLYMRSDDAYVSMILDSPSSLSVKKHLV